MPHYWFSRWANSRRNVPNQRSAADIIQPWPLLPAWHIEINVLPHKAAYSWASPLGWRINWTIFSLFFPSSLSISQVYKQKPFVRARRTTNVSSFFFLEIPASVFYSCFFFFPAMPAPRKVWRPRRLVRCECGWELLRDRHSKSPAAWPQGKDAAKFVASAAEVSVKRLGSPSPSAALK